MFFLYMDIIDSDQDKDKFEKLYLKYRKQMKYIAFKILNDDKLAEDAVHNAFLKIISHLDKFFDTDCQETKNLIVIFIRNTSIDMYRKRKKEFESTDIAERELSSETDFSTVHAEEIMEEIKRLPEIYKDVLLLKIEYGFKDKEIANILDTNTATVSKRLERARRQLKQQLFREEHTDE